MTPNPEKVDWEWVSRQMTLPADLPAKPVRPPAIDISGTWRIVGQDGSTSTLAAGLSHPSPTVEGLTRGGPAGSQKAGRHPDLVSASSAPRQSPGAGQVGHVSVSDLLAGELASPSPAARPAPPPEQGSSTSVRSKIGMPLCAPKLSEGPESKPRAASRPTPSRRVLPARPLGSVAMNRGKLDPQLTRVMDAWPSLSGRTREAILAMVDVALGKK